MKRLLRVLIVEDCEDDATMLLEELRRGGFEVVHVRVQTAEAMRAALSERTWDIVVSDGKASMICRAVHAAVGRSVIRKWTMRRR